MSMLNLEKYLSAIRNIYNSPVARKANLTADSTIVRAYFNLNDVTLEGTAYQLTDRCTLVLVYVEDDEPVREFENMQLIIKGDITTICLVDYRIFEDKISHFDVIGNLYKIFESIISIDLPISQIEEVSYSLGEVIYHLPMVLTIKTIYSVYAREDVAGFHLKDVFEDEYYSLEAIQIIKNSTLEELINECLIVRIIDLVKKEKEDVK